MSDYIKREDAIKRILQQCDNDCLYCMFNWQNDSGDYCAVEECFSDIPSADVVEREQVEKAVESLVKVIKNKDDTERGEWIDAGQYPYDKCSICGCTVDCYDEWNFCPNCGAKMEGCDVDVSE